MPKETVQLELICGHCGVAAVMPIHAEYWDTIVAPSDGILSQGTLERSYAICRCPGCHQVVLATRDLSRDDMSGTTEDDATVIWPRSNRMPVGLPPEVRSAYRDAMKVRRTNANAFAVMLGRVIDKLCLHEQIVDGSLHQRIEALAKKHNLPTQIVQLSHQLRQLRNIGAHADLGELKRSELTVLENLCRAILEYLYSGPHYLQAAKEAAEMATRKPQPNKVAERSKQPKK